MDEQAMTLPFALPASADPEAVFRKTSVHAPAQCMEIHLDER
jgi:hypothetical protein